MIEDVYKIIQAERDKQDKMWGEQNHGKYEWLTILIEEVGEAAESALENHDSNYIKELVQVAAVAVAAIESFTRQKNQRKEGDKR